MNKMRVTKKPHPVSSSTVTSIENVSPYYISFFQSSLIESLNLTSLSIEIAIHLEFLIAIYAFLDHISLSLSLKFSKKMNLNLMDLERHFVNVFLFSSDVFLGSANLNALSKIANDVCFSIFVLLIFL